MHDSVPWRTEATDKKKKVFRCKMCVCVLLLWQLGCQGTVDTHVGQMSDRRFGISRSMRSG